MKTSSSSLSLSAILKNSALKTKVASRENVAYIHYYYYYYYSFLLIIFFKKESL